jgi:hypothetical protein
MSHYEHLLDLLAGISGIIGFAWIGLRSDLKSFSEAWHRILGEPRKFKHYLTMFFAIVPYVFFAFTAIILFCQEQRPNIQNSIMTVRGDDSTEVPVQQDLEVLSTNVDFHITISGSIDEAGASSLISRYGRTNILAVYAVVSQPLRPNIAKPLVWVQSKCGGTLKPGGEYTVQAYLGGIGIYSAKSGQIFPIRIYIPKRQGIDFATRSQYPSFDDLPAPAYLSEAIYIRCNR